MKHILAKAALLPEGWREDVLISVNEQGMIAEVQEDAADKARDNFTAADILIPAMPNLHSHAFQYEMAGLAEYRSGAHDSFWTWRNVMYDFLKTLSPEQLYKTAYDLYCEMLRTGYSWVGEFHYIHNDPEGQAYEDPAHLSHQVIKAAKDAGIGITHMPVLYGCSGFGGKLAEEGQRRFIKTVEEYLALLGQLCEVYKDDGDVRIGCAFHSLRAVTPEMMKDVLAALQKIDPAMPVHIHIAEQVKEVDDCVAWSGQRPVAWLLENFDVNERWCLVHATHMTEEETKALAQSGAVAGVCPVTEANLGDGLFNLESYMAAGGAWGIGSDSHISVDMIEELRWFEYGQRLVHKKRAVATTDACLHNGRYLYEQSLKGGAQAMGGAMGAVKDGYKADFIELSAAGQGQSSYDILLDKFIFTRKVPIKNMIRNGKTLL